MAGSERLARWRPSGRSRARRRRPRAGERAGDRRWVLPWPWRLVSLEHGCGGHDAGLGLERFTLACQGFDAVHYDLHNLIISDPDAAAAGERPRPRPGAHPFDVPRRRRRTRCLADRLATLYLADRQAEPGPARRARTWLLPVLVRAGSLSYDQCFEGPPVKRVSIRIPIVRRITAPTRILPTFLV